MSIETMKQALEALKSIDEAMPFPVAKFAISQLRQAISEAEGRSIEQTQKQEPVTYPENFIDALRYDTALRDFEHEQAQKQEPVAWMMSDGKIVDKWALQFYGGQAGKPLYTSPPQRQPLTDEEIEDVCVKTYLKNERPFATNLDAFKAIARAIEAAHGITGEQK